MFCDECSSLLVKEVKKGLECGITIANFNDLKVGDIIEAYEMVEKARD